MTTPLTDEHGQPVGAFLDMRELRVHADVFRYTVADLAAKGHRRRILDDALAALEQLAASGHAESLVGTAVADNGHGPDAVVGEQPFLDLRQVMALTGKPERSARRLCQKIGTKVAGRWMVHRADLEREV
jgi:hypothetical protein